ncbi:MAG: hypothetical protein M0Z50_01380 [Planctomycetia bacterium]|nr:hypothetical protein [Planctomycetia bacterium]
MKLRIPDGTIVIEFNGDLRMAFNSRDALDGYGLCHDTILYQQRLQAAVNVQIL